MGECGAAGCFLAQKGSLVSLPLVTVAGIVDGINPCAIGMLLLLLGYLIVFAKKPQDVLKIGGVYIGGVYATYLAIGLVFYQTVSWFQNSSYFEWINLGLGTGLIGLGLIQIKDFLGIQAGPHLAIPASSRERLMGFIEKSSVGATLGLAVLVTILETPCSLPLYVGTATVLAASGLPSVVVALYFLYYNLLFVLPLVILLVVVWRGKEIAELAEWRHKSERWMQLGLGLMMVVLGGLLLL